MTTTAPSIRACPCCGLAQTVGRIPPRMRACCARCGSDLVRRSVIARSNGRTAALAASALVLYPFAVGLPMIEVEQFGHTSEASILEGVTTLLAKGQWFVGIIILMCSIVLPIGKLVALLVLSSGGMFLGRHHRAATYRLVEFTGRWGMLDVLLVTLLVAVVKLGDMVEVTAGPAALAFTAVVVLSLLAAAAFDPHALWEDES